MRQHERLDQSIEQRRLELGLDWKDLAASVGIADVTLRNIRRGRNAPSVLNKYRLEDALGWKHGSVDAILDGGDPTDANAVSDSSRDAPRQLSPAEVSRRIDETIAMLQDLKRVTERDETQSQPEEPRDRRKGA
ncbi:MAG: helix-turn-helix domain-containing protein [Streptosporangiales bacterium]